MSYNPAPITTIGKPFLSDIEDDSKPNSVQSIMAAEPDINKIFRKDKGSLNP